jgi:transcriptional regulator with XRE-family HTH domain
MAELTQQDKVLKSAIAQRIEDLRVGTGLTQSQFAKEHAIDRQAISRWEDIDGERGVTIYTIKRFCSMVGISLSNFFDSDLFK